MRLLVDTHALIWAVDEPARLGSTARLALEDDSNEVVISAATVWEIAIKTGLRKLTLSMPYREWMNWLRCVASPQRATDHIHIPMARIRFSWITSYRICRRQAPASIRAKSRAPYRD